GTQYPGIAAACGAAQLAQAIENRDELRFFTRTHRRQRFQVALRLVGLRFGRGDQMAIADEARGPDQRKSDRQRRERVIGSNACDPAAAFCGGIEAGEARFAEDHLVQQALEEKALAGAGGRRLDLALEVEAARERAEHAIDRAAFLGAAGEIDAAHEGRFADPGAAEGAVEKLADQRSGDAVLLRKAVDRGALLQVARLLQPLRKQGVEPPLEMRELL